MLILSREWGQRIHIGDNVIVTVVGIRNGQVRIGIAAPLTLAVDREEVRFAKIRDGDYPAESPVLGQDVCLYCGRGGEEPADEHV